MASKRIVRIVCAKCEGEIFREREQTLLASPKTSKTLIRQAGKKHPCGGDDVRFFVDDEEFTSQQDVENDKARRTQSAIIKKVMGVP
jgi:hypothetical protein